MKKLCNTIQNNSVFRLVAPFIPECRCITSTAADYARHLLAAVRGPVRVLDLGCGAGESIKFFNRLNPQCLWQGVEVEASPELRAAKAGSRSITFFDGIRLPWQDDFFDLVYCQQVLEHVRWPDALLADVFRVLKPGGALAGSVSYLEPCHSLSVFNFTPYGLSTVLKDAGFAGLEMRAGVDAFSLIFRQMFNAKHRVGSLLLTFSPLNAFINLAGALFGLSHKERNFLKLQFAGHICFAAKKCK